MNRSEKAALIAQIKAKADAASFVVVTDFKGMTVEELTRLRAKLYECGGEYLVVKNTLARIALTDGMHDSVKDMFKENCGIALTSQDPVAVAKAVSEFAKTSKLFTVRHASLEGKMLSAAISEGVSNFQISSAYRTYSEQQKLVDNSVAKYQKNNPSWSRDRCLSATYQTVAPAGSSEHQTGLAFDITVPGVSFTGTEQQKWLHQHCAEYGFIVRFTAEKQKLTGFVAESWHFRYVGEEHSLKMRDENLCLEEYIEKYGKL